MRNRMRVVPPLLTAVLLGVWLVLAGEISVAQLAFGVLLSVLFVLAIARLRPLRPRLRRLYLAVPLAAELLLDVARSNVGVARIVLGLVRDREVRSGFLNIPLELSDPHALSFLAVIVTATPGTSWAGVTPDGRTLRLHVLDLEDEDRWIRSFKRRYEQPLMEIFE
jgi:multicomponent K+:H+ antiporter subunit E